MKNEESKREKRIEKTSRSREIREEEFTADA